ncbi:DNA-processing protein DprA [Aureimonas pseudogalii]|uniref:DNA processing protein n=1 Tax=Aureimonas pseudogalii TaxID=1744844 RepID=A0A7W6MK28_9HYPH|nr:DNA-processing protein DprA [Aureimonas pseudogalii]MBB3998745.1 DNA processing protein [Aureimonas pseudogalii]
MPPRRGAPLGDDERVARLRLIRTENVGPVTFAGLLRRFGSASAALDALPDLAVRGGTRHTPRIPSQDTIDAELALAARFGARFVCWGEPDYPPLLREADAAPPVLAVMGALAPLQQPAVAIVGARNASAAGARLTAMFARELGEAGHVIVSGLARGIDTAAHEASLPTGTIGVFAGGLDKPYPRENKALMRRIVDGGGCLVTEMPFGWEPRAADFPRRNRVVVGLAAGVLVVEAALRSGSLISARLAGELGRLVFAVPGSPLDPRAAGTNRLLKDGATLTTETADILEALSPLDPRARRSHPAPVEDEIADEPDHEPADRDRRRILDALGATPTSLEDILAQSGADPAELQTVLLELDLAGRLERHAGGRVALLS